jgi:hypothetical protein
MSILDTATSFVGGSGGGNSGGGGMGYSVDTNASANTDVRTGAISQGFNFGGINNSARLPKWLLPVGVAAIVVLGGLFIWRRYK